MSKQILLPLIAILSLFGIWEVSSHVFIEHYFVLPPPSAVFLRIWEKWDRFMWHTQITVGEMAGGFIIAFLVAFPLAWMMSFWKSINFILQPIFIVVQCVPMFTLAPIMVFWFGWGYKAIVIPTALMIFFPLTMNIYQGLRSAPVSFLDYFRANQATPWQIFSKLQLPWAMPHIFAGFRISAAVAGIGAVAGEWAGAQSGLGPLMVESRRATDLETTFGALFCLAFVSLSLYGLIAIIEKRLSIRKTALYQKRLTACAVVLFCGLLSIGWRTSEDSLKQTRLLLDWLPNPNHIPLYVGQEKGFFAENGFDLFITKIQDPSETIPFLTMDQTDLAVFYMPNTIRAMKRGADVQVVGLLFKKPLNGLIFRAGEGIKSPKDLNGKVLGFCSDGSANTVLDYVLKTNGITPKEKKNVSFDLVGTLGTGKVDVVYGAYWNIECEHLRSLGVNTDYFALSELGYPNYYELIILAKKNSIRMTPEAVVAFQEALQRSIDYSIENPEEAFEIYLKANPDKSHNTVSWEREAWYKTYPHLAPDQEVDQKTWKELETWIDTYNSKKMS